MVVSKQAIIQQIKKELDAAMKTKEEEKVKQRIASIKSLCEVILQEESSISSSPKKSDGITPQELKVMMGDKRENESYTVDPTKGDSIFDF